MGATKHIGPVPRDIYLQRETDAWELRRKGKTHEQIAALMGLERSTITKMLNRIADRKSKELAKSVDKIKTEQIAQLEHIVSESLDEWDRSKKERKSARQKHKTTTQTQGQTGAIIDTTEERTNTISEAMGNTAYLTTAMQAMSDIRKIAGANAPVELDVQSGGEKLQGGTIVFSPVINLPPIASIDDDTDSDPSE